MSKTNDGGPAFARPSSEYDAQTGMSVRVWLVGQVIGHLAQASITNETFAKMINERGKQAPESVAKIACLYADAAIAELGVTE